MHVLSAKELKLPYFILEAEPFKGSFDLKSQNYDDLSNWYLYFPWSLVSSYLFSSCLNNLQVHWTNSFSHPPSLHFSCFSFGVSPHLSLSLMLNISFSPHFKPIAFYLPNIYPKSMIFQNKLICKQPQDTCILVFFGLLMLLTLPGDQICLRLPRCHDGDDVMMQFQKNPFGIAS